MIHLKATLERLDRKRPVILAELHPHLRAMMLPLLADLGGRFTPYCGYRGPSEQAEAFASGASNALYGSSPHNFKPALACDVVLDPRKVKVREAPDPKFPGWPDLWDTESEEAMAAWEALEQAAKTHGLERVNIRDRTGVLRRDRPHLQLHGWRAYVKH